MELSQEMIIDIAMNAAGYVIVSILAVIIYTIFQKKDTETIGASTSAALIVKRAPAKNIRNERPVNEKIEFINFLTDSNSTEDKADLVQDEEIPIKIENNTARRDRSDIIRIAKEMLKAGADNDRIMGVLPISMAELSLLTLANK